MSLKFSTIKTRYNFNTGNALPSFCTANEMVLRAILQYAAEHKFPALIEATCNQVNQYGGYTGMLPQDFAHWTRALAAEYGLKDESLILGGDHLGPNPWRHETAALAMEKASVLIKDYVKAGFTKIHIDTSMACGDEETPSFELVAQRAAELCLVAEQEAPDSSQLIYVIGTEVPIPGGETDDMSGLSVTTTERLNKTIDTHKDAFNEAGLSYIWPRIVGIVTQPGVDFSHTSVHRFEPEKAQHLSVAIEPLDQLAFEAHSTDYQPTLALSELVDKNFTFLKVGPELTFRMREAVFNLAAIEQNCRPEKTSQLIDVIDRVMRDQPTHWQSYYTGTQNDIDQLKHYSYSDRIRYYWTDPSIQAALEQLIANLTSIDVPETLVSQYFPYLEFDMLRSSPQSLIYSHINLCVKRYYAACGFSE